MEVLRLIKKWRRGCKFAVRNPLECPACTERLINGIEHFESVARFSGCITPKFYMVIDRLRTIVCQKDIGQKDIMMVHRGDLAALLNEFFRLDRELRRLKPSIHVDEHNE